MCYDEGALTMCPQGFASTHNSICRTSTVQRWCRRWGCVCVRVNASKAYNRDNPCNIFKIISIALDGNSIFLLALEYAWNRNDYDRIRWHCMCAYAMRIWSDHQVDSKYKCEMNGLNCQAIHNNDWLEWFLMIFFFFFWVLSFERGVLSAANARDAVFRQLI